MCITSLKVNDAGRPLHPVRRRRDQRQRQPLPQGVAAAGYMIYCRKRPVTQEELVRLLWDDGDNVTNPATP